uniref:Uncharacterized protein n=1 Tax=Cacopsylla melanoneura TaxID=428564 RepID=A0A8D9FEJ0_9HEMI
MKEEKYRERERGRGPIYQENGMVNVHIVTGPVWLPFIMCYSFTITDAADISPRYIHEIFQQQQLLIYSGKLGSIMGISYCECNARHGLTGANFSNHALVR